MIDERTTLLLHAGYSMYQVKRYAEMLPDRVLDQIAASAGPREAKQTLRESLAEQKATADEDEE